MAAIDRLRHAWPWLAATIFATFANPWGWGIYQALFRQGDGDGIPVAADQRVGPGTHELDHDVERVIAAQSRRGLRFDDPVCHYCCCGRGLAECRSALLSVAAALATRHERFEALFAIVAMVVGGVVLTSAFEALPIRFREARAGLISCAGIQTQTLRLDR